MELSDKGPAHIPPRSHSQVSRGVLPYERSWYNAELSSSYIFVR